jgi:hypothetical protein
MAMKLHFKAAIVTAVVTTLLAPGLRVVAQSAPEAERSMPVAPETTPMAPATMPAEMPSSTIAPDTKAAPNLPSSDQALPKLDAAPYSEPKVSTSSTPTTAATGTPAFTTMVLPKETITGIKTVELASPPIQPMYFTLPIKVAVAKDSAMTSNTPISDRYTDKANWDVKAWAAAVSSCMQQKPKLMRVVGDEQVPFMLNGTEGTIMLNANDKAVCPMS